MLSNKGNVLLFTVIFSIVLSLVGCNQNESIQAKSKEENNNIHMVKLDGITILSATISRVGESMLDVEKPHITYSQENTKELQTFVDAIRRAEKINGIVDVMAPEYLLTFTFENETSSKYSLWLGMDGGSIMDEKDTHTLYTLPKGLINDLYKIVK
ncbi:hypothetical protein ABE096_10270 [Robertmurraya massiliosenegalensis]|uniref:hypothetical protein n=1 Tax=Robertmurraya TaxID=2837507 RepID=UPI0039A48C16